MANISLKRRIDALEKAHAAGEEVTLEMLVQSSYLPKPLPDDLVRLIEASKLAPLIKEAYGSWDRRRSREGGHNAPPTATPAPAASYRSNPVPPEYASAGGRLPRVM